MLFSVFSRPLWPREMQPADSPPIFQIRMFGEITPSQIENLPLLHRAVIPRDYLDAMGHVNIRHYMALYDDASWPFWASIGMDEAYFTTARAGAYDLQHFIRYLAEIRLGETVAIYSRVLGRSDNRIHFIFFMVNETTGRLASTLEALGAHVDLTRRRMAPFPPTIAAHIDAALTAHESLGWEAPLCGAIQIVKS